MKTIERLKELHKLSSGPFDKDKDPWMNKRCDAVSKCLDVFPALLAVVEAAEKLVALRRTDQSLDWLEKELETEATLDAALRALEGGGVMKECEHCGNERVMVCHNCTGHDHAAELARVEKLLDAARDAARVAIDQMDVWQRACAAGSLMHTKTLTANAILRAECNAWRKWWDAELPIDLNKPDMYQDVACARQDTDAAGIMRDGAKGDGT